MLAVGYFPSDGPNLQDHHCMDMTYFFGRSLFDIRSRDKKPSADCNVCFYQTYPSQGQQPVSTWNKILVGLGWMIFLVSRALDGQPYTPKTMTGSYLYSKSPPQKKVRMGYPPWNPTARPWKLRVGRLYTFLLGFRPIFRGFCCSFYREWTFFHFWESNPKKWHEKKYQPSPNFPILSFSCFGVLSPASAASESMKTKNPEKKNATQTTQRPRCRTLRGILWCHWSLERLGGRGKAERSTGWIPWGCGLAKTPRMESNRAFFDNSGWQNTVTQWRKRTYIYIYINIYIYEIQNEIITWLYN